MGDTIVYTLTGAPAFTTSTQITVTDQLGAGLTFVSAAPSTGTYSSSTGVWSVGTLNGASTITLTITATVNAGTEGQTIANDPGISYVQSNCTESSAVTGVSITVQGGAPTSTTPIADIAVTKTADVATTTEGSTIHYTVTAQDLGPATSTGVVATDTLPSDLTFENATASVGTYSSSTGTWTIGDLMPNATATLDIAAKVNTGTAGTTIVNTAIIGESASTTDNNLSNNSSSASVFVESTTPAPCSLTAAQFEAAVNSGEISWNPISVGTTTASFTIKNGTSCTAPISLISWKMFVAQGQSHWLSTQQRFDVASTSLSASSTQTLTVNLPTCRAQVDAMYGQAPTSLLDSNPYSYPNVPFNLAYAFANANLPLCGATSTTTGFSISKTVDNGSPKAGDTVHYTVTVGNIGSATSTGTVATDTIPAGLTLVSATTSQGSYASSTGTWTIGTLAASSTAVLQYAALVDASDTAGMQITNTATIASDTASVTITVQGGGGPTPVYADISVQKTADVTSTSEGGTIHYTITAKDLGPSTSTDVVATDTIPAGLTLVSATTSQGSYASSTGTWTIGTLAANATATLEIAATANAGTAGTTIVNTAIIGESPSLTDTNPSNNSSSVSVYVRGGGGGGTTADLGIVKTVDNATPNPGDTVHFTLTATDHGPSDSQFTEVTDKLPAGLSFVSSTVSTGTYNLTSGLWTIGNLADNATATLDMAAVVGSNQAGQAIVNTASISTTLASQIDPNPSNNTSSVTLNVQTPGVPAADLSVVKTADVATTTEGGTIHYTIAVTDNGPATSTGAVATDTLPSGLTFENATASVGAYSSSTGVWTIGDLAPSSTATLDIAALVNSGTAGTVITNTAVVGESTSTVDNNLSNNSSSVSVYVQGGGGGGPVADVSVAKSVNNANPSTGDTVTYTITAMDKGTATSTGVVATDTLPSGLTFVSATPSVGTYSTSTGVWTIGDLGPSATATLAIAATVNSGTAGQSITNTVTIGDTSPSDTDTSDKTASATLTVQGGGGCTSNCGGSVPTAEIGIVKTVDNANPDAGATIHYTLAVTASGPSPSIGVVASDTLPAGVTFVSASSSMGSYDSATGEWTIGSMNVGQTATLVITATVNASDPSGETITNTGTVHESPTVNDQNSGNNTSSVTITVAGGGGGGGGTVTVGGGGGTVLGTSTTPGQVLGISTCGLYLDEYIHPIRKYLNTPAQVMKLQEFLNANLGTNLPVTGYYGPLTIAAVNQFQNKYHTELLLPWVPLGLTNEYTPTSYVYQTTWRWINLIECPSLNLPMPTLKVDDFATSYTYTF